MEHRLIYHQQTLFISCRRYYLRRNIFFIATACSKQHVVYTEAVFTDGIEGPYINTKNQLFVVNLTHNGTIGLVEQNEYKIVATLPDSGIGNSIQLWNDSTFIVADYINHIIFPGF